jgi:hypothetical protein
MSRQSRKRREETPPQTSESSHEEDSTKVTLSKEELKKAIREKLKEKRLGRLAPSARDNKIDKLELKLKEAGDNTEKIQKIQQHIDLLKRVNDIQIDTFTGEYTE